MVKHVKKGAFKDVLAEAERELQELTVRAERLKEFITATRKLVAKGVVQTNSTSGSVAFPPKRRRSNVLADHVSELLRKAGRPMHAKEIAAELEKQGQQVAVATIAVALIRRSDQFAKVAPNTFALVKPEEVNVATNSA